MQDGSMNTLLGAIRIRWRCDCSDERVVGINSILQLIHQMNRPEYNASTQKVYSLTASLVSLLCVTTHDHYRVATVYSLPQKIHNTAPHCLIG